MEQESPQLELDLDQEARRQDVADGIAELIAGIEGSVTPQHLESLVQNKVEHILGPLSERQRSQLHGYLEERSYSRVSPEQLADLLLLDNRTQQPPEAA